MPLYRKRLPRRTNCNVTLRVRVLDVSLATDRTVRAAVSERQVRLRSWFYRLCSSALRAGEGSVRLPREYLSDDQRQCRVQSRREQMLVPIGVLLRWQIVR